MAERVIVVDRHDRIIGTKPRSEITPADIYRVGALWLTNPAGDILLAQRAWTKSNNPGKWGPAAAGTVDAGESYQSNIYKEAAEEIGLTGVKFVRGPKTFVDVKNTRRHFTRWFTAQANWPLTKFKVQADEVEQIAWVPRAQFLEELASQPQKFVTSAPHWPDMFLL